MCKNVVLEWFKDRVALGDTRPRTIKEVYLALNLTPNRRRLERVWYNIVKLRESGYLEYTKTIPVRYKLVVTKESEETKNDFQNR